MNQSIIGIGYNNYLDKNRLVAVLNINSSPAQRFVKKADDSGKLIDVTAGRKRKSVIVTDTGFVFVTAKTPKALTCMIEAF